MRVFIGLPLDKEARRGVEKEIKHLQRGHWPVRWEKEANWHSTVAFLGSIEEDLLEKLKQAVKRGAGGIRPLKLEFKGWGSFPDLFLPRVVVLMLKGDLKQLFKLVKQIRSELDKVGIAYDTKPFRAHLTVGRVEKWAKRKQRIELGKILSKNRNLEIPQQWLVDRAVVYESRPTSEGSEYHELASITFAGTGRHRETLGERRSSL
jgi:2'-5' RNA ligase